MLPRLASDVMRTATSPRTWLRTKTSRGAPGVCADAAADAAAPAAVHCPRLDREPSEVSERCGRTRALECARPFEEMPGPTWSPVVGKLLRRHDIKRMHWANADKCRRHGGIVREQVARRSHVVLLYEPRDVEAMFRHEGRHPLRPHFEPLVAYRRSKGMTLGIGFLQGEEWYKLRCILQKVMMDPMAAVPYLDAHDEVSRDFVSLMTSLTDSRQEIPGFYSWLQKWALESISVVLFNARLGCLEHGGTNHEAQAIVNAAAVLFNSIYETMMGFPWWKYLSTPAWRRLTSSHDFLFRTAQVYVDATLARIESEQHATPSSGRHETFLEALLKTKELDRGQACLTAIELMISGIETTASTVAFILYHLGRNPTAQEKLYEEVIRLLPKRDSPVTYDTFLQAHYLRAVFKEANRLNPVTAGTVRILDHDVAFSGYRVPALTPILSQSLVIGRLAKHFDEPERFLPERWTQRYETATPGGLARSHPFAMIPFGFGARQCIGRRFALQEIYLIVMRIMQSYRVVQDHEQHLDCFTHIVNVPDRPLRLRFYPRHERTSAAPAST